MRVGYQRVSTVEQNLDRQELGNVEQIFSEKTSGATKERPALQEMIQFVRSGDEVICWSIDRLARDLRDLSSIITELNEKGVSISFLSEKLTFNTENDDPFAKLQLHLMGAFAEFERNIIKKRQAEGIAKAKERGVYKGRKAKISKSKILQFRDEGMNIAQIAREMNCSRPTVYAALNAQ